MQSWIVASLRRSASQCRAFAPASKRFASGNRKLDYLELDAKWQAIWATQAKTSSRTSCPKSYVLPMFAYPSGSLHMGHLRVYTISDVISRYQRMRGYDVLHPTGWDAFGLPAENAAIERGVDPGDWTVTNIEKMKCQLKSMNTFFDWDAELSTCSPSFYKHTQMLFLLLFKRGLAYRDEALVNYDPVDKTVLANEQVDNNGRSWRSGAVVEQRMLRQWFFKITAFQEELLQDLEVLSENGKWPEHVITQQRNWIGLSKGARVQFDIQSTDGNCIPVNVFTTRPDTLFGVQYLALSFSHPVVLGLAKEIPELQAFLDQKGQYGPESKAGFRLPLTAVNPISKSRAGAIETIPVFAAPYVLENYAEGAVMGVPAHDARDLAFWQQHCPESMVPIVVSETLQEPTEIYQRSKDFVEANTARGYLTSLCGPFAGLTSQEGGAKIVKTLAQDGNAEETQTWRLRDWLVSRQRYWGTPIPIVHCNSCGAVPVPEEDLPIELPDLPVDVRGKKGNPLDNIDSFVNTICPSCKGPARRDTDTMDTFVDSSWYYLRFADAQNSKELFSIQAAARMLPVDVYVGGVEHAILHLLYARFIYKFLCSEGLVKTESGLAVNEPFTRLIAQGMVHGKTFSDPATGKFLLPAEMQADPDNGKMLVKSSGEEARISWEKMSKSKYNGIDPSICISKYGADATRAHMLFTAPVGEVLQWDEEKIVGIQRWFQRITRLVDGVIPLDTSDSCDLNIVSDKDAEILLMTDTTVRSVTTTLDTNIYSLNTVISDLIKLTNALHDQGVANLSAWVAKTAVVNLVKMIAPVAPALAEQCYQDLVKDLNNKNESIFDEPWPRETLTSEQTSVLRARKTTMTCAVQVNGKLRFTASVPKLGSEEQLKDTKKHEEAVIAAVLATKEGQLWLRDKNDWEKRRRVVLVKAGELLNVVF